MNRSRFRSEGRLVWVQGTVYWIGMHFGATWRTRLNDTIAGMETLLTVVEVVGPTSSEGCLLPSSHRHARHDKTVLSASCLAWRCELDNCSERVQISNFLPLSGMQFTPPMRTRHRRDSFAVSGLHGRQRHWNIGGSQVERRRRENRCTVGGEEVGTGEGLCPFPENL